MKIINRLAEPHYIWHDGQDSEINVEWRKLEDIWLKSDTPGNWTFTDWLNHMKITYTTNGVDRYAQEITFEDEKQYLAMLLRSL